MNDNINIGIDWLAVVLPQEFDWVPSSPNYVPVVLEYLTGIKFDPDQWDIKRKGAKWYRDRHTIYSHKGQPLIHIGTDPVADNNRETTTIALTGYALSSRPDALQDVDPIAFMSKAFEMSGVLSRIDIALDYFGAVPIHQYIVEASQPDVWREQITTPLRFKKPLPVGWEQTMYFGHLDKGTVIVAYDKAAETGSGGNWERIELRTKNKDLLIPILMDLTAGEPLGNVASALLWKYLRFIEPGTKSKQNRPVAQWWVELLQEGKGAYEFKRHRDGKIDDDGARAITGPSLVNVQRYIDEALKLDITGEIRSLIINRGGCLLSGF